MSDARYNILMAAQQFDIGGAETHLLELSRALVALGHSVTVVSRGGELVPELLSAGVSHIEAPLDKKTPAAMARSRKIIKKLLKNGNFDVVHAHARIPAFVAAPLAARYGVKFVTTAHWTFKVTPLNRKITRWGNRTIAVSEDIKQYLIDNYGICADNITVTVNGIDTEKFSPDVDSDGIINEFSLDKNARRIVCVSRTDESRADLPLLLANAAERLAGRYPDIEIVIVGGGSVAGERDMLPQMRETAERVNAKFGRRVLTLAGARKDTNLFCAAATVFVGASRAALEAMSAARPTILGGNEGYLGIFDEKKLARAAATNFCFRDCEKASGDALLCDIDALLDMGDGQRRALGEYGRGVIKEKYSAARMAADALAAYERAYAAPERGNVIISGYYGFGNTGDDSLLAVITDGIRRRDPDAKITVLCNSPRAVRERYGVRTIHRFSLLAIIGEMCTAGVVISGGGNLLQNSTSGKSLLYYSAILRLAKICGCRTMIFSSGIGPVIGKSAQRRVLRTVTRVNVVTLRERASLETLRAIGVPRDDILLRADPALLLPRATNERIDYILSRTDFDREKKYYILSLRENENLANTESGFSGSEFLKKVIAAVKIIAEKYHVYPILIPMQPSNDTAVCRRVADAQKGALLISGLTASEIISLTKRCEFAVGMRLHILIYALAAEMPFAGLSYDPKVKAFLDYSDVPYCLNADRSFTAESLVWVAGELLMRSENLKMQNENTLAEMQKLARKDFYTVKQLRERKGQ